MRSAVIGSTLIVGYLLAQGSSALAQDHGGACFRPCRGRPITRVSTRPGCRTTVKRTPAPSAPASSPTAAEGFQWIIHVSRMIIAGTQLTTLRCANGKADVRFVSGSVIDLHTSVIAGTARHGCAFPAANGHFKPDW